MVYHSSLYFTPVLQHFAHPPDRHLGAVKLPVFQSGGYLVRNVSSRLAIDSSALSVSDLAGNLCLESYTPFESEESMAKHDTQGFAKELLNGLGRADLRPKKALVHRIYGLDVM